MNGNAENFLEHAINTLNSSIRDLPQNPSKEELKAAIKQCGKELKRDKTRLTDYVPYKLLYPFFDAEGLEEGLSYIKDDKHSRLIAYMARLSGNENLLYTILDGAGLQKKVRVNVYWRKMLLKNFSVIQSWVQYNKAQFYRTEIQECRALSIRSAWKTRNFENLNRPVIYGKQLLKLPNSRSRKFIPERISQQMIYP